MRRLLVALVCVLTFTSCTVDEGGNSPTQSVKGYNVKLPGGGTVICVVYNGMEKGGVSCDWEGRR